MRAGLGGWRKVCSESRCRRKRPSEGSHPFTDAAHAFPSDQEAAGLPSSPITYFPHNSFREAPCSSFSLLKAGLLMLTCTASPWGTALRRIWHGCTPKMDSGPTSSWIQARPARHSGSKKWWDPSEMAKCSASPGLSGLWDKVTDL